jgi:glycosyltransferase involved in cell wall biosynthesis
MVRVVIHSVATAPGGGLTNLLGLLEGWQRIRAELDITVLASRPETVEALEKAGRRPYLHVLPVMGALERMRWERRELPGLLRELKADLFLSNNAGVPSVPCPQVVHHQNLFTCYLPGFLSYLSLASYFKPGVRSRVRMSAWLLAGTWNARRALRTAAANVFISNCVRRYSEALVPESSPRNHTIYYGLSERYQQMCRNGDARDAARVPHQLCAVQHMLPYKDTESVIEALAETVRRAPQHPWSLHVAGWDDFSPCVRLAERRGVADRIRWLGYLDSAGVADLLARSSILVYPSIFEGFGLPVLEAMAAGCAVVTVDTTAIPEIAGDAALLVPPRSPHMIAEAVLAIGSDDSLRQELVRRGRRRATDFSWTRAAREFCQVFAKVLGRPIRAGDETLQP